MESKEFTYERLPENLEEFRKMGTLETPFETAALTVVALAHYPKNRDVALAMLDYLKGPQPLSTYEKQFIRDRFMDKDYVPRSYFEGTSPANNYEPSKPYRIRVSDNPYSYAEEGYAKLFLTSSGADSPRPIVLRRKGDQWFLWEQLLLAGIRVPDKDDPWK